MHLITRSLARGARTPGVTSVTVWDGRFAIGTPIPTAHRENIHQQHRKTLRQVPAVITFKWRERYSHVIKLNTFTSFNYILTHIYEAAQHLILEMHLFFQVHQPFA